MTEKKSSSADRQKTPSLNCWYCGSGLNLDYLLRDAILRTRREREGGPYRMYSCTSCSRRNHCEKTRRGRWFSSPDSHPMLLDYILGRFIGQPQDFIRTVSWYAANEERRRYYFEHDGDYRYSGGFIKRLLKGLLLLGRAKTSDENKQDERKQKQETTGEQDRKERARPPPRQPELIGPWTILGVERNASQAEIRRAFHKLAVQYHPDKVHHMGEDFQRIAHEKFTELQEAYERMVAKSS